MRQDKKLRTKGASTDSSSTSHANYGAMSGAPAHRRNRYETANCCSRLTWTFVRHLLAVGKDHPLQYDDLEDCPEADSAQFLAHRVKTQFERRRQLGLPVSTGACLVRAFGAEFVWQASWMVMSNAAGFSQALAVREVIMYVESGAEGYEWWYGYAAAAALTITNLAISMVNHRMYFNGFRMGMQLRTAVSLLIFEKSLKISTSAFAQTTTGQMVNLLSSDVTKFDTPDLQSLWSPLILPVLVVLLWREIGEAALIGLGLLFIFMPIQTAIGGMFGTFRRRMVEHTDQRVRLLSELLSAADIVKLYNWEEPLEAAVFLARSKEYKYIVAAAMLRALNNAIFYIGSAVTPAVTFIGFVLLGGSLENPAAVFTSIVLLNFVRTQVTNQLPRALEKISEARVSCSRLDKFFSLEENIPVESPNPYLYDTAEVTPVVVLENAHFAWSVPPVVVPPKPTASARKPSILPGGRSGDIGLDSAPEAPPVKPPVGLHDINLKIFPAQLVAICGPVGSCKSSLLAAILGEMQCSQGLLWTLPGKKSFASQKAFIVEATIRENILFGRKLDRGHYAEVLHACCLEEDLAKLPAGDFTAIGERGVNLSGGQRARIALARAVYARDTTLYLFDDVLSAVDPIVAQHIFDGVLGPKGILRRQTRILVTHQTQFLPFTNMVVLMDQGAIVAQGTYAELVQTGALNPELLESQHHSQPDETIIECPEEDLATVVELQHSVHSVHSSMMSVSQEIDRHAIIVAETRDTGEISSQVWRSYFAASGCCFLLCCAFTLALAQLGFNGCDLWLSFWSSQQYNDVLEPDEYIYIYAGIVGFTVLMLFIRSWVIMIVLVRAAASLYNKMFRGLLYSPLRFYEQNPAGRILNRLTKDQAVLDEILPVNLLSLLGVAVFVLGMLAMAFYALPVILLVLVPAIPLFMWIRSYYLTSTREIKRLDALSRSPIFSLFSATLGGLPVIRAFQSESILTEQFYKLVNINTQAYFALLVCVRWLGFRLDLTCSLFIASTAFLAVYTTGAGGDIQGARIALGLSYVISLTGWFQFVVRQGAEVENDMTSTERIVAYTNLPREGERYLNSPPPEWPQRGLVEFQNVSMRYRPELPLVLRHVNLRFEPREKIGVCGRTGAGKSSLFQVCFRLVEELCQGQVLIDNVPIHTIGLADLRSKLAIIPQNAAIFSGTIRYNLDPFGAYHDSQIWDALRDVQLYDKIHSLPEGLYTPVAEQGGNFSAGEGQLLCIARCILRPSRILFVDEATANVDPETDHLIQRVIRAKFVDRTVITIAHRLTTILDCDKILVMDAGQVVEFATPAELLSNPESFFCRLRAGKLAPLQGEEKGDGGKHSQPAKGRLKPKTKAPEQKDSSK